MTSPSTINRCAITIQSADSQVPAQGGSGSIAVAAARDCTWTAATEGPWLSIKAGANGQGDGKVEFSAAANIDPATRRGAIVLNNQRAEITQAAAACQISLGRSSASFGQSGGQGTVPISASSAMCAWSASSDAEWIVLRPISGSGNGQVAFEVQPTTGPPRSGTITIAAQKFSVTQSEGCDFSISPASHNVPPAGGAGRIAIATTAGCPWTASSNVEWIKFAQASGSGPASVAYSVDATAGPARTGTAVVAGHTFAITQSQGCGYIVAPTVQTVGAAGGNVAITVTSGSACPWTAASEAAWITVASGAAGTGDGTVTLAVAATSGAARTGTATIAGQRVTITQSQGCAFTIAPENASVGSGGGTGKVTVTAGAGCSWTASSSASWLTITSGAAGTGNGEVQYSAAATGGPGRTATLTIAGRTFTLNQGQGCTFTLSPTSTNVDDGGGQGTFNVQSASGCTWTAESAVSWITITPPASGAGDGQVRFSVAANSGSARSGAITAGGQTFTVQQGNGCSFSLSAASQAVPAAGGSGNVNVTAPGSCAWTATSNANWLSITSGASGTGNGRVEFAAAANTGPARSGTLTIGGRTFTVSQPEGCTYTITPDQTAVGNSGGQATVNVAAPSACSWTTTSNASWIHVSAGGSGTGNGAVQLTVDANSGGVRSGTATIAGQTFTVNQGSGCAFVITPTSQNVPAGASSVTVDVTAPGACAWTAASNAAWLTVSSGGSGSGNGTVRIDVQANPGAQRNGTATIAGQTFTVTQESGCSFVVAPETIAAPAAGMSSRVDVTTVASCAWTASSGAAWIGVAPPGGTGTGAVDLTIAANTGPARSGVATVGGRAVTVNQESGCVYGLSATGMPMTAAGGNAFVNVTAGGGCPWTAVSQVSWI
ncbi:MAG: BACON domain-containing protein, partial [Vicinamibacterales bacterium]